MALFPSSTVTLKNGQEVLLRHAKIGDAEKLLKAVTNIFSTSPYILSTPESLKTKTVQTQEKWIQDANEDPRNALVIAEHKGHIVGIADFRSFKDTKRFHRASFGMSVHQDFRGLGLGEAVLQKLIEVCRSVEGLTLLELNVMEPNISAHKLYLKTGFKEVGRYPGAYRLADGTYTTDIMMTKHL
ncbi:GNAT family N-acetyltransferase [Bdellovibrio sp. BCCA]|uniref:GNAT family N-acetyltransferase n=1 Tax=Bdellovibrio sp. BCCA TaxID=3136281 RepID=UPI0030F24EA5